MRFLGPGHFRLLLAFIVVLHHSTPLRLGAWAVGLFFCLSGFWIAEMWGKKYSELDKPYIEFMISRWWRLGPVLFSITIIAAVLAVRGWFPSDERLLNSWQWWFSQPLIAGSTWAGRLLPTAWSLDVEMQFYLVAPLMICFFSTASRHASMATIGVGIAWCWLTIARGEAGESARLDIWVGVFAIGIFASVRSWHPRRSSVRGAAAATALIFAFAAALPATRSWIVHRGSDGPGLRGLVPATLTVGTLLLAVPLAISTTRRPSGHFDRFLGDLSYPLYLFHWLPRTWYYSHINHFSQVSQIVIPLAINLAAATGGAVAILLLIDRPAQRARAKWVRSHLRLAGTSTETTVTHVEAD